VHSSIISGNVGAAAGTHTDVDSVEATFTNTFQSLGYNLIGKGNSQSAFSQATDFAGVTDPLLAPLADNTNDPLASNPSLTHAPLPGSLAINGGSPTFNPNSFSPTMSSDQRGATRVQGGRIDIGAHESELAPSLPADFDGDNDVDGSDFLSWQRNVGSTNATKADGDANGNGAVNGQDLAAWRSGFGQGGGVVVAASSASVAASSAALEAGESVGPPAANGDLSRIGSLGIPGAGTIGTKPAAEVDEATFAFPAAADWGLPALAWDAAEGFSALDDDAELSSLLAGDTDESTAEDAVFAAWGEELL
jgi:hypothetical protein